MSTSLGITELPISVLLDPPCDPSWLPRVQAIENYGYHNPEGGRGQLRLNFVWGDHNLFHESIHTKRGLYATVTLNNREPGRVGFSAYLMDGFRTREPYDHRITIPIDCLLIGSMHVRKVDARLLEAQEWAQYFLGKDYR